MLYIAIPMEGPAQRGDKGCPSPNDIKAIQQKIWHYTLLAITLSILTVLVLGYRYLSTFTRPIRK